MCEEKEEFQKNRKGETGGRETERNKTREREKKRERERENKRER